MKKLIEYFCEPRHLALAIIAVSGAMLVTAYVAQYGFGLNPCILCLYQRVPYFVTIALGAVAFAATYRYPKLVTLSLLLTALTFFIGAGIAGFHVGVEQHWWKGLSSCGGDIVPTGVSVEELRKALTQQKIVRCDEAAWTLFGVSMAGYNFLMSLIFGIDVLFLLRRKP